MMTYPIEHIVIIFKENHTYDNYLGDFVGGDGINLPQAPNPPTADIPHDHTAWLNRSTTAVKQQYKRTDLVKYYKMAKQYAICDKFFSDVAGPSTPNHLMLLTADSPIINNVNWLDFSQPKPPYNLHSLAKQLEGIGLSWRNYGGGSFFLIWELIFSLNHRFSGSFAPNAQSGNLPTVSWLFAPTGLSEHPPQDIKAGEAWTVDQINALVGGGNWDKTAIFLTWDDWGGWSDHVNPPNVESWTDGTQFRYGSRVPCIVMSPYAKKNYISPFKHSFISIIKFVQTIFGLPSLNSRNTAADNMMDCFNFSQTPLPPPAL